MWECRGRKGLPMTAFMLGLLVALVLLVRPQMTERSDRLTLVASLVIGLGCGSGATLIVGALFLPMLLVARWVTAFDPRAPQ